MEKNITPIKGCMTERRKIAEMTRVKFSSGSESFFRITEDGDYRITEDELGVRLLEQAP